MPTDQETRAASPPRRPRPDGPVPAAGGDVRRTDAILAGVWSRWAVGLATAVGIAAAAGVLTAELTPRGPVTPVQVLVSMVLAVAVGAGC